VPLEPWQVSRFLPAHFRRTPMHVCLWALGCLPQWSLLPHRPWLWCDRHSWWGDTMALRIGTGDSASGGMDTGATGMGDPVTITATGTAGNNTKL
jgi:hypothetical protein